MFANVATKWDSCFLVTKLVSLSNVLARYRVTQLPISEVLTQIYPGISLRSCSVFRPPTIVPVEAGPGSAEPQYAPVTGGAPPLLPALLLPALAVLSHSAVTM